MKTKLLYLTMSLFVAVSQLIAQTPELTVGGKKESTDVYLQKLDIQVDVTGSIATTQFTMTFKNRTGRILEGELLFPLSDGATVSRYALDINGKMRDAVPVEKAKATQVFEEIEQRRVDPGLLERVEGNNFRTRIYPIPANGSRTISISYEQELPAGNNGLHYRLPMDYKEAIDEFSVKVTVWQSKSKPQTEAQGGNEIRFDAQGSNFVSSFSRKDYLPSQLLAFSLPVPADISQVLMQSASGSYYFMASCYPEVQSIKKEWADHLGVIWDVSLSGLKRDVKRELEILDAIFKEKKNLNVTLYFLNNLFTNGGTFSVNNGDWTSLKNAIQAANYDGGTNYSSIKLQNAPASEFLFFSDGLSSLSDADFIQAGNQKSKAVHCIVSSSRADYSSLKWIAAQTNGKFVNLNVLSQSDAISELGKETLCFLGVKKSGNIREVYPSVSTPVHGNFSVAGIMQSQEGEITLLFGYGNQVKVEKRINLNASQADNRVQVHRMWAQKKINELDMRYDKNKQELTELGQEFGIVTRNTSLIVLETLQDYITYQITPPEELLAEYNQWKKNMADTRQREAQSMLELSKNAAAELKKWWNTDFTLKEPKYPKPDKVARQSAVLQASVALDVVELADERVVIQEEAAASVADGFLMSRNSMRAKVEKESTKSVGDLKVSQAPQPTIRITPVKQDAGYMKGLTGNPGSDYKKYLETRPDYIGTPSFYFDMADWFYKHNEHGKAICILTSIADMDLENASLFRLLGYRLKEYGEYALEAYICRKVVQWRPMEPQSYRDYALALKDNGQYQAALDSLYSLLAHPYAQNISRRSAGIEEVVVTEMNQLITGQSGLKPLRTAKINQNLLMNIPVDIRVVINWNMNSTDIDLHVTDPNGETCSYSNRSTATGGRISRDITQGYGPEQFMIKKALKGKYKVYVNYFGDSQVKKEGPSTVMIEVYTNYGKANQKGMVTCTQLSRDVKKSANGLVEVAEFEF